MFGHHSHTAAADANIRSRLIHWARFYDPLVTLLTLGRVPAMREQAADLAGNPAGRVSS